MDKTCSEKTCATTKGEMILYGKREQEKGLRFLDHLAPGLQNAASCWPLVAVKIKKQNGKPLLGRRQREKILKTAENCEGANQNIHVFGLAIVCDEVSEEILQQICKETGKKG